MPSPWEVKKAKRSANIGFISKLNAFKDPTPAEKASALATEINSWQASIKKTPYSISAEYSMPQGQGFNLKQDTHLQLERMEEAKIAYLTTPMDDGGILKAQGINVTPYENPPTKWQMLKSAWSPLWEESLVFWLPVIVVMVFILMLYGIQK